MKLLFVLLSALAVQVTSEAYVDLSAHGTANCYVVSQSGLYGFKAVKGNGGGPVGEVAACSVLWETFCSSEAPECGDLIVETYLHEGNIYVRVPEPFRKGNAVVAAKDASGKILWSWHIWLTDSPSSHRYADGGVVMDRNLGALSVSPLSHESYGLLYQWGRKDPFLGSCISDDNVIAASTAQWPCPEKSDVSTGTIEYAVANPLLFITCNPVNDDWQYVQDDTRWGKVKTIYDPCPPGWKVPSGCFGGFNKYFEQPFSGTGIDFGGKFSESDNVWFPATGYLYYYDRTLYSSGLYGSYWFSTTEGRHGEHMFFYFSNGVYPMRKSPRANAFSVRCVKE